MLCDRATVIYILNDNLTRAMLGRRMESPKALCPATWMSYLVLEEHIGDLLHVYEAVETCRRGAAASKTVSVVHVEYLG